MINNSFECNKISSFESLTTIQKAELEIFIKGLIQGACCYKDVFTVPDLVGGKFTDWSNTPLDYIYKYHVGRGCEKPQAEAGKDMGRIFKYIMAKDKYHNYTLVGTEQRFYPVNKYKLETIN